jgi:hypothetical protein
VFAPGAGVCNRVPGTGRALTSTKLDRHAHKTGCAAEELLVSPA